MNKKAQRRQHIKTRVRGKIRGSLQRPRLSVFRSNRQIYAQIIDDVEGCTLASSSTLKMEISGNKKGVAAQVGREIARVALAAGIDTVVFDRNGYLYHGRIKEFANAARIGGLKF